MRTKTLILTAALTAAGIATSMAQVYSVNAVGYVNTTLPPGFSLISNPLTAANNTIGELFKGVPPGFQVFKYTPGSGYEVATMDDIDLVFLPTEAANKTVLPGEGVFVRNPGTTPLTVTFVGEVSQGNVDVALAQGLSIVSSKVPQAGTAEELGLKGQPGDQVFQFDNATGYYVSTFDDIDPVWLPALKPLKVGEAIFFRKANAGTVWTRNFDINE